MSFSGDIKRELSEVVPKARHCMLAELRGMLETSSGRQAEIDGRLSLRMDNPMSSKKFFTIFSKAFNIDLRITERKRQSTGRDAYYLTDDSGRGEAFVRDQVLAGRYPEKSCCRRAYLRGAFLCAGTISDPDRYYHLEISVPDEKTSVVLCALMQSFDLHAKTVVRKHQYVVYLKESDQIAEALRLMGAGRSLMNYENIRIVREMRGTVNRQVNCETANLRKTVDAAMRQTEDIRYLKRQKEYEELSPALRNMAETRLAYPEASLTELGELMTPKVGKSGINHRLRKLQELAESCRSRQKSPSDDLKGG